MFISSQIRSEKLLAIFEKNYNDVSPLWSSHQLEWTNGVYGAFKDHDKYMIVLYLIKKTFDFYSKNFVKESYDSYFKKNLIEVDTFNVMEVSKALNIPKETTRRKINELVKSGAINKFGKRVIIDKSVFPFVKPENSIIRVSRFLSTLSSILCDEKVLIDKFNSIQIQDFIEKNFSHIWKLYYEVQIPWILNWKKVFKDIESFHVWAVCVVNQKLNSKREKNVKMNKKIYIKKYFFNFNDTTDGINAMSISDISGIPRATVIRKLNLLVKENYLNINDKKHYIIASKHKKELVLRQRLNFSALSKFTTRIFNLMLIEESELK
jgi:DNA-binding Lrp family transcriptional regulator